VRSGVVRLSLSIIYSFMHRFVLTSESESPRAQYHRSGQKWRKTRCAVSATDNLRLHLSPYLSCHVKWLVGFHQIKRSTTETLADISEGVRWRSLHGFLSHLLHILLCSNFLSIHVFHLITVFVCHVTGSWEAREDQMWYLSYPWPT